MLLYICNNFNLTGEILLKIKAEDMVNKAIGIEETIFEIYFSFDMFIVGLYINDVYLYKIGHLIFSI